MEKISTNGKHTQNVGIVGLYKRREPLRKICSRPDHRTGKVR